MTQNKHIEADNEYIVAVGASAGGLDAINELFDNIPAGTGFIYVVIQHLSPDHKSLMGELLSKHTMMQVFEAGEDMALKPDNVYLLPAGKTMTVENRTFKLHDKLKSQKQNTAIDIFFLSLAEEAKDKAIGIILSGTGTDGTSGIEAIKSNGGIVIVQDPLTAEFDGMPNSAIGTGFADLILAPDMMPDELLGFIKESPLIKSFNNLNHQEEMVLMDILDEVHKVTHHDFSHYKRPTITRRLAKRMGEQSIKSVADYYELLKTNAEEARALRKEFLINVTKFFRDEEAFAVIKTLVVPFLLNDKKAGDTLKMWVVACSTGEEAYSMAILVQDYMEANKIQDVNVKIFATDIDEDAIDVASKGLYPEAGLKDMPAEMVTRYFTKEGNSYRIIPLLRKMVVFARHDVSKDPPFSKVDFLACRNMLIYMSPLLQKVILQKFHFALNQEGYLFMGPSENLGALRDVMKDVDKKWKIYKCASKAKAGDHDTFFNPLYKGRHLDVPMMIKPKNAQNNISDIFKETLLEEFDYAGIYIDKDFEVKQATGNFKKFISLPEGNFNLNLLKLVPPDLSIALGTCIRKAIKDGKRVVQKKVKVAMGATRRSINIIVKPYLAQKDYLQPFVFVILGEDPEKEIPARAPVTTDEYLARKIDDLEAELRDTKENLQAVIEELESANEELQSGNEEIVSSNEELQSTNEELQSLNEELHTVNAEHQLKIKELIELNDDMNNYFRNTEIGQILIDKKLIIKKFSPAATKQVNMIASDVGRSITDISVNFKNLNFINDIKGVMASGIYSQKELVMPNGTTFLMRIAPYIRQDKSMDGVVVSFINISEVKQLDALVAAIFNGSLNGIMAQKVILDGNKEIADLEIIAANDAVGAIFDVHGSLVGKSMRAEFPDFMSLFSDKFTTATDEPTRFEYFESKKTLWLDVVIVKMPHGYVTTFTDISETKRSFTQLRDASDMLKATNSQLEKSNYDLLQFAAVASHDLKEPLRKIQTFGNKLMDKTEGKLDESEKEYLNKIINASQRMQTLIEDILMLSKLSNNGVGRAQVDLSSIIKSIADDLEIAIKEKNARLEIRQLPVIRAIPGQIHQLFQNLISNSIKFNKDQPPVITIAQRDICPELAEKLQIDPQKYVCITVEDNGIGFDQEYSEKIFELFQRLNGSIYTGTGIGLAICKKIIENHQGYIFADGKTNRGAMFTILLPKER